MNQGTQGYNLTKKTEGRKARETIPINTIFPYTVGDSNNKAQGFQVFITFSSVADLIRRHLFLIYPFYYFNI
jgi:hypothetical protein